MSMLSYGARRTGQGQLGWSGAIVLAAGLGLAGAPLCRAMETTAASLDGTPGSITAAHFESNIDLEGAHSGLQGLIVQSAFTDGTVSEAALHHAAATTARLSKFSPVVAAYQNGHLVVSQTDFPGGYAALIPLHAAKDAHAVKVVRVGQHSNQRINIFNGASAVAAYLRNHDPAVLAHVFDGLRSDLGVDVHEARAVLDSAANAALYSEMQSRWIPDADVAPRTILYAAEHGPHIGAIPEELTTLLGSREAAFQTFDRIANELGANGRRSAAGQETYGAASRLQLPLQISLIESGNSGAAYRLIFPMRTFVLKVFAPRPGDEREELRVLLFFAAHGAWDIMKTYAARLLVPRRPIHENMPWMLSELVPERLSPEERAARGHSSIARVIEECHLDLDPNVQADRVGGVLTDAGKLCSHDN